MTQQYLAGELSVLLGALQAAAPTEASARDFADLRHEAETRPPPALAEVTARALALTDELCWDFLAHADTVAFSRQAAISAELHEFGVCAGFLPRAGSRAGLLFPDFPTSDERSDNDS